MPKVTLGMSVGTWLNTEVRVFYHHTTLLQEDGGWVEGIPETTAELLGPFLALCFERGHRPRHGTDGRGSAVRVPRVPRMGKSVQK